MLRSISVRTSLLGILAVLGLSYLLLLLMVQITARSTHQRMETVSSVLFPATLTLQQANVAFEQTNKDYKDAVLLEDVNGLEAAATDAEADAQVLSLLVQQLQPVPALAALAAHLQQHQQSLQAHSRATYGDLLNKHDTPTARLQGDVAALARDKASVEREMNHLSSLLEDAGHEQFSALDGLSQRLRLFGFAFLLVSVVSFGAAWWVVRFKVVQPLRALARRMQDIAEGEGDLTDRIIVRGQDELDEVGHWFNIFIERMEHVVLRVTDNARALAGAASTLAGETQDAAAQSLLQQHEAVNISHSMNEISVAARAISTNTHKAAEDARRAAGNARTGEEIIRSTVMVIENILISNRFTAAKLAELGRAGVNIENVTKTIYDISCQASLLALNASIEAARAGEHGRGFAVVADEVRRLAESTSERTHEIEQTVQAIRLGTSELAGAISATTREVEEGIAQALAAGAVLAGILEGSEAMQTMVTHMASASSEQSSAAQAVNVNLEEIASLGSRVAGSSARAVTSCEHLSEMAANLNGLVRSFKVGDSVEPPAQNTAASRPRLQHPPTGTFALSSVSKFVG